jgi:hypothetical protein
VLLTEVSSLASCFYATAQPAGPAAALHPPTSNHLSRPGVPSSELDEGVPSIRLARSIVHDGELLTSAASPVLGLPQSLEMAIDRAGFEPEQGDGLHQPGPTPAVVGRNCRRIRAWAASGIPSPSSGWSLLSQAPWAPPPPPQRSDLGCGHRPGCGRPLHVICGGRSVQVWRASGLAGSVGNSSHHCGLSPTTVPPGESVSPSQPSRSPPADAPSPQPWP